MVNTTNWRKKWLQHYSQFLKLSQAKSSVRDYTKTFICTRSWSHCQQGTSVPRKLTASTNHSVVDIHWGTCGRKVQWHVLIQKPVQCGYQATQLPRSHWQTGLAPCGRRGLLEDLEDEVPGRPRTVVCDAAQSSVRTLINGAWIPLGREALWSRWHL